jgi:hypothetical protein
MGTSPIRKSPAPWITQARVVMVKRLSESPGGQLLVGGLARRGYGGISGRVGKGDGGSAKCGGQRQEHVLCLLMESVAAAAQVG